MKRRDLLKMLVAATGTALVGSNVLAYTILPMKDNQGNGYSKDDMAFFNEVGESIIPRTDTPRAKDANVGSMIAILLTDCYLPDQRKVFNNGMVALKSNGKSRYSKEFVLLTLEQRLALLSSLYEEANRHNKKMFLIKTEINADESALPHYFSMFKQLVLFSFFSSEVDATKVVRYEAVPGFYDGEIPYRKGDKAWAT
jgi:hypothetical protein